MYTSHYIGDHKVPRHDIPRLLQYTMSTIYHVFHDIPCLSSGKPLKHDVKIMCLTLTPSDHRFPPPGTLHLDLASSPTKYLTFLLLIASFA
uniref:Uncharacterized protein n=1 Tax=Picea sitchensis TaxID=3332 RepID=A0A6B9XUV3_PICSI|nr:hypothetical protein Q903MT_gene6739 [Picea sitchensis]